ncbi:antitoxin VapB family protein [Methanoplanus endosymbiosus]|uniref:Antitoxin n=1 Tax=Methanoplanus endosymbiosus TaxID=33865 RepID=A0A9E7THI4_9EURY|nr:antitoxin VapB family protein [Methanoplanus endosymbiosus]UUX92997.1 hypothetical protein L6E24_02400 [Methanoplanus endosymbiosus]
MTTKAVNLSEEAYNRLNKLKLNEKESLSNVILRVTPRFKSSDEAIEAYEKKRKGDYISDEEAERILSLGKNE